MRVYSTEFMIQATGVIRQLVHEGTVVDLEEDRGDVYVTFYREINDNDAVGCWRHVPVYVMKGSFRIPADHAMNGTIAIHSIVMRYLGENPQWGLDEDLVRWWLGGELRRRKDRQDRKWLEREFGIEKDGS